MAEYALNPASAGAPGQMRLHFLEQYAATCHTKHAEPAASVHELAVLAAVLRIHKPARDLLAMRLAATIGLTVQSYSGGHRLGKITVQDGETLMQLRQRIFGQQSRSGATAKSLVGSGNFTPSLRASKVKGKFTLEWRHQAHVHRHFSSAGTILSYDNARETAISGALLFMTNLSRDELPPSQSRSAATLHDQRFDHVQMQDEVRELLQANSSLTLDFDDASKRGISFLGSGLHGTRQDGSYLYAVTRVTRLRKDLETLKTKSGRNTARALFAGLEAYAQGRLESLLWQIHVLLCDTTASMTGTLIKTGEGGATSHLRARIEQKTRGVDGEQGHLLVEQRDCASHAGHNECEAFMGGLGLCDKERVFQVRFNLTNPSPSLSLNPNSGPNPNPNPSPQP